MQTISRDRISGVFDRRLPPAAVVASGEAIRVETEDARYGMTLTPETCAVENLNRIKGTYLGNPVTGPIFVTGAEPGDTLAVEILEMELPDRGFTGYWPETNGLMDLFPEPHSEVFAIADGMVHFRDDIRIPVRPMIGTIGTAPEHEVIKSGSQGPFGGNMDVPDIGPGATVYLPVTVPGALLSLGDCHAVQGDGEISAGAVEIRASVTLSARVIKGRPSLRWPRVETAEAISTVGMASPLEEAGRIALREMLHWLESDHGLSRSEAYMLMCFAGHMRPGQMVVTRYTMRAIMPKRYLTRRVP